MYSGTNITAIRSMTDLSQAIFTLLKKYNYNEITITMICQEACISRQTFYKLFNDKKEIIHYLITSNYQDFEHGVIDRKELNLREFTEYTFLFFWDKKELIDLLIHQELEHYFLEEIRGKLSEVLLLFQASPLSYSKPIYNFFTGGLSSMILYQIGHDKKENVRNVAKEFSDMLGNPTLR